jgi:hypothetical protein
MSHHRSLVATLALFLGVTHLVGCHDPATAPVRQLRSQQPALAVTTNSRTPADFTVATCGPDVVTLVGEMHLVVRRNVDSAGGLHLGMHSSGRYVGVGASGTVYSMNLNDEQSVNLTAGAHEFTFETQELVVSRGSQPNFDAHLLIHTTLNADGEPTADTFDLRQSCNG